MIHFSPSSFFSRVRHQWLTEMRRLRLPWAVWCAASLARLWDRLGDGSSTQSPVGTALAWLPEEAILWPVALWIIYRTVQADPPGSSDTASHTRPLGGQALWAAKALALGIVIVLPWVAADLVVACISGQDTGSALAIVAASLLFAGLIVAVSAAAMSLAGSLHILLAIVATVAVVVALWHLLLHEYFRSFTPFALTGTPGHELCASIVSGVLLLAAAVSSWWLSLAARRRGAALAVLAIGLAQAPFTSRLWPYDWVTPQAVSTEHLLPGVEVGPRTGSSPSSAKPLWPGLRITGLGADEVATVLSLTPETDAEAFEKKRPVDDYSLGSVQPNSFALPGWLRGWHLRAIAQHYPADDLWSGGTRQDRPALHQVIAHASEAQKQGRWKLRLALHAMRRMQHFPLKELWNKEVRVHLRPGVWLGIGPGSQVGVNSQLKVRLQSAQTLLLPTHPASPVRTASGKELTDGFCLVMRDPEVRECLFHGVDFSRIYVGTRSFTLGWLFERRLITESSFRLPDYRMVLLEEPPESLIARVQVDLWTAEDRGEVEVTLTGAQMAQAAAVK